MVINLQGLFFAEAKVEYGFFAVVGGVILLILSPFIYELVKFIQEKKITKKFREFLQALADKRGYKILPPGNEPGDEISRILSSFERRTTVNVKFRVFDKAMIEGEDLNILLFFYKWMKQRGHIRRHEEGSLPIDQKQYPYFLNDVSLRTALYIPCSVNVSEVLLVRGKLDWKKEQQIEYEDGMPTTPAIGLHEFDTNFICKGKDSAEAGRIVTKEFQELILQHQGKYPFIPEAIKKIKIYFSEKGIKFTVEDIPDENQFDEMMELAVKIYEHLN